MSDSAEQPVYFGPGGRPLFGWLHPGGAGPGRGTGIVFCNALGYESISSHRTIRAAAHAAAARGFATLRFDYDGTGDSAGLDTDPARLDAWMASIEAALDQLRAASGVHTLYLWGLRLGATLAVLAAKRRPEVRAIHAVAPVPSGRKYLRELRALAGTGAAARAVSEQQEEVAGFIMTTDTVDAIASIDLQGIELPETTRLLCSYRDDMPFDDAWIAGAQARGCQAAAAPFSGYAAMMLDPHEVIVPTNLIDAGLDWLLSIAAAAGTAAASGTAAAAAPVSPTAASLPYTARIPAAGPDQREELVETALRLGENPAIFAIVSQRAAASAHATNRKPRLLLLLNSGSVPRIGPNRVYVTMARMLASRGMIVARIDLPGLGDSPPHIGAQTNLPYSPTARADIQYALLELQRRFGPAELHVCGICSGAYYSLKCALDMPALRTAVPINPLTFFWKEGMTIQVPEAQVTSEAARYGRNALRWSSWIKLLRGRVNVATAAHIARRRVTQLVHGLWRDAARRLGIKLADDLGAELRAIAKRKVQLHFIFADSDPGLTMLQEQGGAPARQLVRGGQIVVDVIANTDHIFVNEPGRRAMLATVVRHFEQQVHQNGT